MKPKLQNSDDSSTDTKKNYRAAMNSSLSNFNPEHDPVRDLENLAKK